MLELTDMSGIIWLLLTAANVIVSMLGFRSPQFFEKYLFSVDAILREREYIRILSSGFLHTGWMHLFFNMYSFYFFGRILEDYWGAFGFAALYFGSLVGGDLLALYMHRHHGDYRAVGASGAVSGVIFSYVLLVPDATLGIMFIPFPFPAWMFAILYTLVSIYGMRSQMGNIGHDAHLGGAMAGIVISIILQPSLVIERGWLVALLLGGFGIFLWLVVNKPAFMLPPAADSTSRFRPERSGRRSEREVDRRLREELDELLEKMHARGWDNLSEYEQRRLHYLSDRLRK
jgi:membrane associated rhomboid family serine protease